MLPRRVKISKSSTEILKILKVRTGLTPNIVCRIALILSLEDGEQGGVKTVDQLGSEFNNPTLFGEFGPFIDCLLREVHGELDIKITASVIASHIDSGLDQLKKSKSLLELIEYCGLIRQAG